MEVKGAAVTVAVKEEMVGGGCGGRDGVGTRQLDVRASSADSSRVERMW